MSSVSTDFARGDFAALAGRFKAAGFAVAMPLAGVLELCRSEPARLPRRRLLISVAVHGDETAPLELLALLMEELSQTPAALACDLMLMIGNLAAVAAARRFIDVDLNRLFTPGQTQFGAAQETRRAEQLMSLSRRFFDGHQQCWHLDLHTAIRASVYPSFAIVPGHPEESFVQWLADAGIEAVVFNPEPTVTFSAFTARHLGVLSCTAELGRIGVLGHNDLSQFATTQQALGRLLRGVEMMPEQGAGPLRFRVVQELIKHTEAFALSFDDTTQNFTAFAPGTVIARDGERSYVVGDQQEFVLFPNAAVRPGLRAGLMVVKT